MSTAAAAAMAYAVLLAAAAVAFAALPSAVVEEIAALRVVAAIHAAAEASAATRTMPWAGRLGALHGIRWALRT